MPTLNWIGKEAVVNHDKEVPFRLLRKVKSASVGDNSQNLIIHGDNLEALKALMPYYVGKIKCIYIDPPYNTGNEGWVYNDKVNSPKIKKWLGKVVGGQSEDLCRHDKWLCMMYPRLKLLKDLLSTDGVIFISIDDNEHCNLKQAMDEIFGEENFVTTIIWQKKYAPSNDAKYFSNTHDFIICYAKNKENEDFKINLLARTEKQDARYKNPDNDTRGPWKPSGMDAKTYSVAYDFEIITPSGRRVIPPKGSSWRFGKNKFKEMISDNRIWFGKDGSNVPAIKRFLSEVQQGIVPTTIWYGEDVGFTDEASKIVKEIFSESFTPFNNPKPVRLIKHILQVSTKPNDLILDSFAGSGTTGHAVLDLNKEDGGNRKFILVEMEDKIAKDITAERVKRAIKKYDYKDGFEYCELDKPLFDEKGQIEETCEFNQFATYIYFTETQTNIDKNKIEKNFIGEHSDTEFYLIYKEKDKNILTKSFLSKLRKNKNKKIVYADKNYLDENELLKYNILFKQIPYEVKVY
jgi:adenine specific DNA methylase Mod